MSRGLLDGLGTWWLDAGKRRRLAASHVPWLGRWMNGRVPREPSWRGKFGLRRAPAGDRRIRRAVHLRIRGCGSRPPPAGARYPREVGSLHRAGVPPRAHASLRPAGQLAAIPLPYDENRARRATRTAHGLRAQGVATMATARSSPPTVMQVLHQGGVAPSRRRLHLSLGLGAAGRGSDSYVRRTLDRASARRAGGLEALRWCSPARASRQRCRALDALGAIVDLSTPRSARDCRR